MPSYGTERERTERHALVLAHALEGQRSGISPISIASSGFPWQIFAS